MRLRRRSLRCRDMGHRRNRALLSLALLTLLTACSASAGASDRRGGGAHQPAPRPSATPSASPAPAPAPALRSTEAFTGTIARSPGAPLRFGPGLDMPVMDVDAAGREETFDGWFRR